MKTKLVLWGTNAQDEKVLIGLELVADESKVKIFTFPEGVATEEFSQLMMNEWRDDHPVEFPLEHSVEERPLTISDRLLPDDLKVEREDIISRAQTEWHFIVLSAKLNETYRSELEELKDRIDQLSKFDSKLWEELKGFWDKVQTQVRDRNLFREHANALRDQTNALFDQLKKLRNKLDEEFKRRSKDNFESFMERLEQIEGKITEGLRLQNIFDELKGLQRKFKNSKFTREHRTKIWDRLDASFKTVKEKRFGPGANQERTPLERLQRRYEGLLKAVEKMENSISRDNRDLKSQERIIERTYGQLEAQLGKAKIKMIEERIRSKNEKLGEMMTTKKELEEKLEVLAQKEAQRKEREKMEEARKEAEKKIAEGIRQAARERIEEHSEQLEKAVEAIKEDPEVPVDQPNEQLESTTEDTPEELTEEKNNTQPEAEATPEQEGEDEEEQLSFMERVKDSFEDAVDTAKAVALVLGDKLEEVSDKLEDKFEDVSENLEEKVEALGKKLGPVTEKLSDSIEDAAEKVKERFFGDDDDKQEEEE